MINRYDDYITALLRAGFAMGSDSDNIYSIVTFDLNNPGIGENVRWFTQELKRLLLVAKLRGIHS